MRNAYRDNHVIQKGKQTVKSLNEIGAQHFDWVERMGWHNKTTLESIALIASEVGEAAAECQGERPTSAYGEELADIVLRTTDLAQTHGIDLDQAVEQAEVTWQDPSLRGAFAELMVDIAHWINTARGHTIEADFAQAMGRVMRRIIDMAERANVDLEAETRRKMEINEKRGTRGRRI